MRMMIIHMRHGTFDSMVIRMTRRMTMSNSSRPVRCRHNVVSTGSNERHPAAVMCEGDHSRVADITVSRIAVAKHTTRAGRCDQLLASNCGIFVLALRM